MLPIALIPDYAGASLVVAAFAGIWVIAAVLVYFTYVSLETDSHGWTDQANQQGESSQ